MHPYNSCHSVAVRLFAALALLCLPAACHGQNGSGIYMGQGLVLRAAAPHQLTLNAHVSQFVYQPGGDSIAYVSTRDDDGKRTVTVKFVGANQKDPDTRTLYTVTGDAPDAPAPQVPTVDLLGWSADGRYLLLRQEDANTLQGQYVSVDVGTEPFQVRQVPTPELPGNASTLPQTAWSPDHRRLLIVAEDLVEKTHDIVAVAANATELYDPARDQTLPVSVAEGLHVWGWMDGGHLLFFRPPVALGDKIMYFSHDLATGVDASIPRPRPWPPTAASEVEFSPFAFSPSPAPPGLTLETQYQTIQDEQGVATVRANALWVRRAKAPKALSALPVGVTPGSDDPLAQWSPEGDAIAFIAHEDLFVAALTEQEATPHERVAAGETLDCEEERRIIEENLKQLGLGIIQYVQDNDEKLPSATGWHDAVYPYVKDENVFNFAGVRPVYHAPANLALAAMDSPATYVLATADTPCAHIVLYGDGHVKSFDHDGKLFPPSEEPH